MQIIIILCGVLNPNRTSKHCLERIHFYFQVFFDKVFGISFEQILSIISNSDNEGVLLDRKSSQEKVG